MGEKWTKMTIQYDEEQKLVCVLRGWGGGLVCLFYHRQSLHLKKVFGDCILDLLFCSFM